MDDAFCTVLWWMYIVSDLVFIITVAFSFWVSYDIIETGKAIDELETQIMSLLDEALQILIPTPVLNYISQYDVANFEMTETGVEKKIVEAVSYAEDVSRPLSEKSQMYEDFGDPQTKPKKLKKKPPDADFGKQAEFLKVKSYRSNEMVGLTRSKSSEPNRSKTSTSTGGKDNKSGSKLPMTSGEKSKTPQAGSTLTGKSKDTDKVNSKRSKTKISAEAPRSNRTAKSKEKMEGTKVKEKMNSDRQSGKSPSTRSSSKTNGSSTKSTKSLLSKTPIGVPRSKETRSNDAKSSEADSKEAKSRESQPPQ